MPEVISRERLNEIIDQFATAILDALETGPTTEEGSSESEMAVPDTKFMALTMDEKPEVVDAADLPSGALILLNFCEFFHVRLSSNGDWMSYLGEWFTDEEFAEKMRDHASLPTVVHWG